MSDQSVKFSQLGLSEPILRALQDCGYASPTPIQQAAIPILNAGHDLLASAQTGTGKTAAFMLPIIEEISTRPSAKGDAPLALVLAPTRELAVQIDDNVRAYGRHVGTRACVLLGGVSSGPQIDALRRGVDVVIATPGRLIDLIKQGEVILDDVEFLVLDEADRMLDMGFIHDVRWIADQVPTPRQTMLFSATLTAEVRSLASTMQTNPRQVNVAPPATVADNIEQRVMFVEKSHKRELLSHLVAGDEGRTIVFTGMKFTASRLARHLEKVGVQAGALHSDRSQSQRQRTLEAFAKGKVRVLVATDVLARGIDVDDVTHVINYDLPADAENYVHRIGRTARAGKAGVAVSLCCVEDILHLRGVERLVKKPLTVNEDHKWHSPTVAACRESSERAARQRARAGRMRGSGSKWAR